MGHGMVWYTRGMSMSMKYEDFNMKHESAWAFPIIELELELEFYLTGYMVLFAFFTGGEAA